MKENFHDWTFDVSNYLFMRRMQTNQAYESQLIDGSTSGKNESDKFHNNIIKRNLDDAMSSVDNTIPSTNLESHTTLKQNVTSAIIQVNNGYQLYHLLCQQDKGNDDSDDIISNDYKKLKLRIEKEVNSMEVLFTFYSQTLFSVIFSLLAESLDKGHTVLSLREAVLPNDKHKAKEQSLLSWQVNLIEGLLIEGIEVSISSISSTFFATDSYQNERIELLKKLCYFFKIFNELTSSETEKLELFANQLSQLSLFTMVDEKNENYVSQITPVVMNLSTIDSKQEYQKILTFWIQRSWHAEQSIVRHIRRLNNKTPPALNLSDIDTSLLNSEQLSAITNANSSAFCIITGGPGTGKTYTVAQLVIALHHANEQASKAGKTPLSLVLSAPTGKAAQRMQESLQNALNKANVSMILQEAKTIHRLLGIGQSGIPHYNQETPLSEDIIIVDEASMLGVELANSLLSAVKTGARLILLGDSHQLSAVEAGAVLYDLCQMSELKSVHSNLTESRRFTAESAVGQLANYINNLEGQNKALVNQHWQALHELFQSHNDLQFYKLETGDESDISFIDKLVKDNNTIDSNMVEQYTTINAKKVYQQLIYDYHDYFTLTKEYLDSNILKYNTTSTHLPLLMHTFNRFRILTAGHRLAFGDEIINEILSQQHRKILKIPKSNNEWYHGRPIMVRRNNYALGLFNGDIGICIQWGNGLAVYFEGQEEPISISMLINLEVNTAYAMTVHKSQGSEFEHVAIMLDVGSNARRLLSREMLYTGITRAKRKVSIYATMADMQTAITSPTVRYTGLVNNR